MDERERVLLTLAGVRVFMGVFWLVNLLWRLPTDFGEGNYWGLPRIFEVARKHGISPPVRSFVSRVLVPHMTVVGWLVFAIGLISGLLLVFGLLTRFGAALGLLQAIVMTLFLANAPGEWLYAYLMLVLLSALLLLLPVSRRLSLDDALGRDP
jgi:thiosulfate dehydrogenase [quinone] large subunit